MVEARTHLNLERGIAASERMGKEAAIRNKAGAHGSTDTMASHPAKPRSPNSLVLFDPSSTAWREVDRWGLIDGGLGARFLDRLSRHTRGTSVLASDIVPPTAWG